MSIPSIEFLAALLLLIAAFHLTSSARVRQWLLAACNFAFVALAVPNYFSWIAISLFVVSGYAIARVLLKRPSAPILAAYFSVLILAFLVLKKYALAGFVLPAWIMTHPIGAVGLSYVLFRQIHFVVDVMQGQIPHFTFWSYLNYQFNLFGFMSGPIQRYQDFDERWRVPQPVLLTSYEVARAFLRLFIGVLKVSVISAWFLTTFEWQRRWFMFPGAMAGMGRRLVLTRFLTVLYTYPLYLYFNFSGYCDVVIAGAALIGIKLPENFDRPYLARNVSDYWTRFHQSLGFWIRDYLFMPLYRAAATRWPPSATMLVFPCYLFAFILAGIWHGSSLNFVVFGVLHGLGVCAGKLWENYLIKRKGRKGLRDYLASWPIRITAIAATLNFVAFTMLFFPVSVGTAVGMLGNFVHYMRA